ncbi:hypothetical protein BJ742DRAFT_858478 [Cladochytrium replicatum]|nr:hypothetical protein BJ742DRAFT_858478 [Cladochytrium replicatum]
MESLQKLTVPALKDLCRSHGLTVGGNKAALIERLVSKNVRAPQQASATHSLPANSSNPSSKRKNEKIGAGDDQSNVKRQRKSSKTVPPESTGPVVDRPSLTAVQSPSANIGENLNPITTDQPKVAISSHKNTAHLPTSDRTSSNAIAALVTVEVPDQSRGRADQPIPRGLTPITNRKEAMPKDPRRRKLHVSLPSADQTIPKLAHQTHNLPVAQPETTSIQSVASPVNRKTTPNIHGKETSTRTAKKTIAFKTSQKPLIPLVNCVPAGTAHSQTVRALGRVVPSKSTPVVARRRKPLFPSQNLATSNQSRRSQEEPTPESGPIDLLAVIRANEESTFELPLCCKISAIDGGKGLVGVIATLCSFDEELSLRVLGKWEQLNKLCRLQAQSLWIRWLQSNYPGSRTQRFLSSTHNNTIEILKRYSRFRREENVSALSSVSNGILPVLFSRFSLSSETATALYLIPIQIYKSPSHPRQLDTARRFVTTRMLRFMYEYEAFETSSMTVGFEITSRTIGAATPAMESCEIINDSFGMVRTVGGTTHLVMCETGQIFGTCSTGTEATDEWILSRIPRADTRKRSSKQRDPADCVPALRYVWPRPMEEHDYTRNIRSSLVPTSGSRPSGTTIADNLGVAARYVLASSETDLNEAKHQCTPCTMRHFAGAAVCRVSPFSSNRHLSYIETMASGTFIVVADVGVVVGSDEETFLTL